MAACLAESYPGDPGTSPAALVRDVFAPPPPPAALVAYCCAAVLAAGGAYLRGRLHGRFAVLRPSGEVALGGRAFRRMAELAGAAPRAILAGLPPVTWNYEA